MVTINRMATVNNIPAKNIPVNILKVCHLERTNLNMTR